MREFEAAETDEGGRAEQGERDRADGSAVHRAPALSVELDSAFVSAVPGKVSGDAYSSTENTRAASAALKERPVSTRPKRKSL